MIIRPEHADDEAAIAEVTKVAFTGHPYSDGSEPGIIAALRKAGALSLSLVAETGSSVIGHVALSPVEIEDREGQWFGLGPISVLPDFQGQGIGTALMRAAIAWMTEEGASGCVLVGDVRFYGRFGFAALDGLVLPGVPPQFVLALPLSGPAPSGIVSFHPAFLSKDTAGK